MLSRLIFIMFCYLPVVSKSERFSLFVADTLSLKIHMLYFTKFVYSAEHQFSDGTDLQRESL